MLAISRLRSDVNDVSTPMEVGEVRPFVIRKANKRNCGLFTEHDEDDKEVEIKIRRIGKIKPNDIEFHVVGYKFDANVKCYPGHISNIKTKGKTEQCGIGKILMQLCLIEKDIHNVDHNKNQILEEINDLVAWGKRVESCKGTPQEKVLSDVYDWASVQCEKMVFLTMQAQPPSGGHVYLNGAFDSGYTEMFIALTKFRMHPETYPQTGHGLVDKIRTQYNDDGDMEDEGVSVHGENWYFCKL